MSTATFGDRTATDVFEFRSTPSRTTVSRRRADPQSPASEMSAFGSRKAFEAAGGESAARKKQPITQPAFTDPHAIAITPKNLRQHTSTNEQREYWQRQFRKEEEKNGPVTRIEDGITYTTTGADLETSAPGYQKYLKQLEATEVESQGPINRSDGDLTYITATDLDTDAPGYKKYLKQLEAEANMVKNSSWKD